MFVEIEVQSDAHELYKKFGFQALAAPEILMEIHRSEMYEE